MTSYPSRLRCSLYGHTKSDVYPSHGIIIKDIKDKERINTESVHILQSIFKDLVGFRKKTAQSDMSILGVIWIRLEQLGVF